MKRTDRWAGQGHGITGTKSQSSNNSTAFVHSFFLKQVCTHYRIHFMVKNINRTLKLQQLNITLNICIHICTCWAIAMYSGVASLGPTAPIACWLWCPPLMPAVEVASGPQGVEGSTSLINRKFYWSYPMPHRCFFY